MKNMLCMIMGSTSVIQNININLKYYRNPKDLKELVNRVLTDISYNIDNGDNFITIVGKYQRYMMNLDKLEKIIFYECSNGRVIKILDTISKEDLE